jgi:hypothetical protein
MPDPERVIVLLTEIGVVMRHHLAQAPPNRDRVYEALDALAFAAALTIKGADPDEALEYFSGSLNRALAEIDERRLGKE